MTFYIIIDLSSHSYILQLTKDSKIKTQDYLKVIRYFLTKLEAWFCKAQTSWVIFYNFYGSLYVFKHSNRIKNTKKLFISMMILKIK